MRRYPLIALLFICLVSVVHAQITLPGKDDILNKAKDVVKQGLKEKLDESRADYDAGTFNYAIALTDNAGLYENTEKFEKHKRLLLEVARDPMEKRTSEEKAINNNEAGEVLYASGKFKAAGLAFTRAKTLYEGNGITHKEGYAATVSNMGLLYHTMGRFTLSEEMSLKAIAIHRKQNDTTNADFAASINNLAVLYKDMGAYVKAEKLIKKAQEIDKKVSPEESPSRIIMLNNEAMIYYTTGRYDQAITILKKALDKATEVWGEKSNTYVKMLTNLAVVYRDKGDYEVAEEVYLDAIKTKKRQLGTGHPDYAHLLSNLASLYMLMNKYDEVEELLEDALDIYEKKFGEEHPSYATGASRLGNFYRVTGQLPEAEKYLVKSLDIRKKVLGEEHPDVLDSKEDVGILNEQKGNKEKAYTIYNEVLQKRISYINEFFPSMSEKEKEKFWDKQHPSFQRFYSFVVNNYKSFPKASNDMFSYHLATKGLLLNATNKAKKLILSSGDEKLIADYKLWLDTKENLARVYTYSKEELKEEEVNLDSLENAANDLEKSLSQRSSLFQDGYIKKDVSYKEIETGLAQSEAIVDIVRVQQFDKVFTDQVYYLALVLKNGQTQPSMVVLDHGKELEMKTIKRYNASIQNEFEDTESYNLFWKPISNALTGVKKVFLVPDGVYNQLSLYSLRNPETNKYLIDALSIVQLGNSKDLVEYKKRKASLAKTATFIGFPNYGDDNKVAPLPGTKTEVEKISGIVSKYGYKTNKLLGDDASERAVKDLKSPKIVHLATHGFFISDDDEFGLASALSAEAGKADKNPMLRSGLLFSGAGKTMSGKNIIQEEGEDGVLTAFEVSGMQLEKTDIVVLSACETGLGDVKNGEGVYGLKRAFQVAGAKAVIMSLWKVNDATTQELMTEFYKNFMVSGNLDDAFAKAQKTLKTKYEQPLYWGAFVLVVN